jgi:hypothetical protein
VRRVRLANAGLPGEEGVSHPRGLIVHGSPRP